MSADLDREAQLAWCLATLVVAIGVMDTSKDKGNAADAMRKAIRACYDKLCFKLDDAIDKKAARMASICFGLEMPDTMPSEERLDIAMVIMAHLVAEARITCRRIAVGQQWYSLDKDAEKLMRQVICRNPKAKQIGSDLYCLVGDRWE